MREIEIDRGDRVLRARDAGEPGGPVMMYFHWTPGSRIDLCFAEHIAAERGVRLVPLTGPYMAGPLLYLGYGKAGRARARPLAAGQEVWRRSAWARSPARSSSTTLRSLRRMTSVLSTAAIGCAGV